MVVLNISKIML